MSTKYHIPLYWHAAALFLTWCAVQYLDGKAAESDKLREKRAWGYMRVQCSKMGAEPALDVDGRFICQHAQTGKGSKNDTPIMFRAVRTRQEALPMPQRLPNTSRR